VQQLGRHTFIYIRLAAVWADASGYILVCDPASCRCRVA
jgi:hypothetical protein